MIFFDMCPDMAFLGMIVGYRFGTAGHSVVCRKPLIAPHMMDNNLLVFDSSFLWNFYDENDYYKPDYPTCHFGFGNFDSTF